MSSENLAYVNWREMIKPEKLDVTTTSTYGKFVCEPLERGYGITIGNSLRRIILSSIYGAAIVSVKFDDALHEYSVISDIREDVSEIILNLKELKLKVDDPEEKILTLNVTGEAEVTGADIVSPDGRVKILNPEQHIATVNKNGKLNIVMVVKTGKGYALSSANKDDDAPIGTIPIDSAFSPIKRVKYVVGTSRIGQKTDYDKLTFEVWTDGSVTPDDAVAYGAKILKEQMNPFINFDEELEPDESEYKTDDGEKGFNENIYRSVDELELSVRSSNCLKNARIHTIYQLVQKTDSEMLKTKNFGRKSLNEIKEVLNSMELSLGMDLEGIEPPEDVNIQEGE
ncbi:MAG TPA: DNA-directed RNA polymerase subunit alpha [Desulfobacter sp.]|mgnify:CR=1 FL=1|jgi:DNA-directed RNA polymerase subunit alpha|uniref:DNA-directed RNA polymerase subunit alpha n=1 Tax=unclassified Desulfobacter TaxID=2634406 RepID=UPI000E8E24F7|nr:MULTISPECIES: DNA-directed RNA polymerase subunit alpha [unclassified Desulfobacter]MDQ1270259.1 DNA-directed polymerase subunit alpha [Thermodesulfobacteriota bacterium]MBP8828055.1 DNA-directed RNA polymerase subunit alpha [Desulfobacter sp.]MBP9597612.1 DNA-directed RNA polymerase subunit alpha [Desulfobacter sp.]HAR35066.1 DNA-directed RNA polymerase subunit alpha [Desulfobacter sp.]HBT87385.1 DNA-directed RNA polymerase subunit alpha [Desulfobacter sp.]